RKWWIVSCGLAWQWRDPQQPQYSTRRRTRVVGQDPKRWQTWGVVRISQSRLAKKWGAACYNAAVEFVIVTGETPHMQPGLILAALVGLALGALVNWLASTLPARRHTAETAAAADARRPLARVIAVEIVLAVLAAYLWSRSGTTVLTAALLVYMTVFTLIAVIDIEHRLVLNVVMVPAFAVALVE